MSKRITIIQGHPDPAGDHLCHALAAAYIDGAHATEHETRLVSVAELDFPLLRTKRDFDSGKLPAGLREARNAVQWANHVVILFPLWLGGMPALLRGFLEQLLRPGFAFDLTRGGPMGKRLLTDKSARIIVTMGMPVFVYRWYFGAHSVKNLKRNILAFSGFSPVRTTLFGMVEGVSPKRREEWLTEVYALGCAAR